MDKLPKRTAEAGLPTTINTGLAIDTWRRMLKIPEVAKALSPIETNVLTASTKLQISEMDDQAIVDNCAQIFHFVARDVGYIIPSNNAEWSYMQTRLVDILKRYYSYLTLADVKLAFELATIGELDEYLPRDAHGNPDRKHYQQFNADYLSKILNAYRRKQNDVLSKAFAVLPKNQTDITPEKKIYYRKQREARNRYLYLKYKYTGELSSDFSDEMFLYGWLIKIGFAEKVKATESDRRQAFAQYMHRASKGMINQYTAINVRRKGIESPEIDYTAFEIARKKEIIKAFDRMVSEEVQIENKTYL